MFRGGDVGCQFRGEGGGVERVVTVILTELCECSANGSTASQSPVSSDAVPSPRSTAGRAAVVQATPGGEVRPPLQGARTRETEGAAARTGASNAAVSFSEQNHRSRDSVCLYLGQSL